MFFGDVSRDTSPIIRQGVCVWYLCVGRGSKHFKVVYMGETKRTLNIRAEKKSQPSSLQVKGVTLQSTAGNTIMTLIGNIIKYWILRKTGKQEPSRRQSTQKKTSIISMQYPSSYQIFGHQYCEKTKQRKQPQKIQPSEL